MAREREEVSAWVGEVHKILGKRGVSQDLNLKARPSGALLAAAKPEQAKWYVLAAVEQTLPLEKHSDNERLANYTTCVAAMTFTEANASGKYDTVIAAATTFLKGLQQSAAAEWASKSGGVGHDGSTWPDLWNTHFFIDALAAAEVSRDDPSINKELAYVSRCQNLMSEFNTLVYAS